MVISFGEANMRFAPFFCFIALAVSCLGSSAQGRPATEPRGGSTYSAQVVPAYCLATHNIGQLVFGVTNNGTIGAQYSASGIQDCFTGELVPNMEYPKGSDTRYLYGAAFWIGAIVGKDTLVSVGQDGWHVGFAEFHPDESPFGDMIYRSNIDPTKPEYEGAVSEQDYIAVYTDTFTSGVPGLENDVIDNRPHRPLHIEVTQRSYAWSYAYAEDFVLFDYEIKNIGHQRLRKVYLGIYVDADVHHEVTGPTPGSDDDVCGFLKAAPAYYLPRQCPDSDRINLAWIADNNGDFELRPEYRVKNVTGMRVVRTPSDDSLNISFNWWVGNTNPALDWGPQRIETVRDLSTGGLGTPEGDRNKYHFMSNGEFDYDQVYTYALLSFGFTGWLKPPPDLARRIAVGYDTRYLLSFGPFDIEAGQSLPLSFAYVGGEGFQKDSSNFENLPDHPDRYYDRVDFSDFAQNAIWADWVYDNPGIDTDGDGDSGVFYDCYIGGDSSEVLRIARKGDGVPDFRGAAPPPAPSIKVEPRVGAILVRWNGARSETTKDNFSNEFDFEGFRVWVGRDDRQSSFVLFASYDIEDYNKWVWDDSLVTDRGLGGFALLESPFGLEELRCLYAPNGCGDESWHPLDWTRSSPYRYSTGQFDSIFYFEKQDFNQSILANYSGANTTIRKCFPGMEKPPLEWVEDTSKIPPEYRDSVLTEDGAFKYYEYEYLIDTLLATVPYWINVTAFDYGSPQSGLASLETSPAIRPVVTYAHETASSLRDSDELDVYVYPNPYRLDAGYRSHGYEGRGSGERDRPDDRVRRIHFAGLPPKCLISIFTLDGDLVREIDHDIDPGNPLSNHDTWDLITRNTQIVVSGIYYWTVETPDGRTQVGKLVIIL
jgi:hypothetical protein